MNQQQQPNHAALADARAKSAEAYLQEGEVASARVRELRAQEDRNRAARDVHRHGAPVTGAVPMNPELLTWSRVRPFATEQHDLIRERLESAREAFDLSAVRRLALVARQCFTDAAAVVLIDSESLTRMDFGHIEDASGNKLVASDPDELEDDMYEAVSDIDCWGNYWTRVCVDAPENDAYDAPETIRDKHTGMIRRAVVDVERALELKIR